VTEREKATEWDFHTPQQAAKTSAQIFFWRNENETNYLIRGSAAIGLVRLRYA
jgi:hypothetical protein